MFSGQELYSNMSLNDESLAGLNCKHFTLLKMFARNRRFGFSDEETKVSYYRNEENLSSVVSKMIKICIVNVSKL